ncbi:hypothetical protein ACFL4U_01680 [Candidatus Neomarinimicrobiota bacterium]
MRRLSIPAIIILVIYPLISSDCSAQDWDPIAFIDGVLEGSERHLENYAFDPQSDLLARVKEPTDHFINYIQQAEGRQYTPYFPSDEEMQQIAIAFELLPPLHRKILRERLVELCFLQDFSSSGWTDWLIDNQGDIYCAMALKRSTLETSLNEWLTSRAGTCFFPDSSGLDLCIDVGTGYTGFLGILLHETTHIVDYVLNITPFVEPSTYALAVKQEREFPESYPFVENIWEGPYAPLAEADLALGDSITFYGTAGGPKLGFSSAPELYTQLTNSQFVSLYASTNWADDLAELALFYHLTEKLRQPYTVSIMQGNEVSTSFQPLDNPRVRKRLPLLEMFYSLDQ